MRLVVIVALFAIEFAGTPEKSSHAPRNPRLRTRGANAEIQASEPSARRVQVKGPLTDGGGKVGRV